MDEKTILLFDDYIQGALSAPEQEDLERRLQEDPTLADAFHIFKELNAHLTHRYSAERAALEDSINEMGRTHIEVQEDKKPENGKVIAFKPWKYLVAACVVFLFGVLFWMNSGAPTYSDYALGEKISLTQRGEGEIAFAKAEKAFNNAAYDEAIMFFDTILSKNPENAEVSYYKGIALVELDSYTEAERLFEKIATGNSVYKYKALWYKALSYLKQGDKASVRQTLERIPLEAEDYDMVQDLLDDL